MERDKIWLSSLIERIEKNYNDQLRELKYLQSFLAEQTKGKDWTQMIQGFNCHHCKEKKHVVLKFNENDQLNYYCEKCQRTWI